MLKDYVLSLLSGDSRFQLTESQRLMIEKLAAYITGKREDEVFMIRGYAGTGKTTMINHLTKALDSFRSGRFCWHRPEELQKF